MLYFLILLLIIGFIWLAYGQSQSQYQDDLSLTELAALQSKYAMLELDVKDFEKQKLEILNSINKISPELQAAVAVITSLTADSAMFKKHMTASVNGLADANIKIVNMAKEIATRITKADLDQVRALLESKVSTTDVAKLTDLIYSIDSKVDGTLSKEEIYKIVKDKADQAALANVIASVKEISNNLSIVSKDNVNSIVQDIILLKTQINDNTAEVKESMIASLKSLENMLNESTAEQIATIRKGLEDKIDVTVSFAQKMSTDFNATTDEIKKNIATNEKLGTAAITALQTNEKLGTTAIADLQTNVKTLLGNIPELKNSIAIITKALDNDAKLTYIPEDSIEFKAGTPVRFAMFADSGVINIGYTANYTGEKIKSVSLEQIKRILGEYDASIGDSANVWFRSEKNINTGGRTWISFGIAESYVLALMDPDCLKEPERTLQLMKYTPATISANTSVSKTLSKSNPLNPLIWPTFFSRLTLKAIYSMIQLSSRMDCRLEFVLDFKVRQDVKTVKARPAVIQMKAFKDQPYDLNNRYQPRIYFGGVVDASNGLTVPDAEYTMVLNATVDEKVICPMNSYMCGLYKSSSPICCSFNPGASTNLI